MGKATINGPFSMAMSNYQRVVVTRYLPHCHCLSGFPAQNWHATSQNLLHKSILTVLYIQPRWKTPQLDSKLYWLEYLIIPYPHM